MVLFFITYLKIVVSPQFITSLTYASYFYSLLYLKPQKLTKLNFNREIRVLAPALIKSVSSDVFMNFPRLHTAFIDSHEDFVLHIPRPNNDFMSIGHYRLVAPQLPRTLRRLWITNAHGPDIRVIQSLCIQCPLLEELWIERCTLFSPRPMQTRGNNGIVSSEGTGGNSNNTCHFWSNFPNDHDAYFAAIGVEEYAVRSKTYDGPSTPIISYCADSRQL